MALTLTNALKLSDTVAYALYNINQTLVAAPYSGVSSILNGLSNGSPSMMEDIVNFLDAPSETILLPVANQSVTKLNSALVNATTLATYYTPYYALLDAMETLTNGFAAFLTTNNAQVAYSFATLWNAFAGVVASLGLRPASYILNSISASQTFPDTSVDLGAITIGGTISAPLQSLDGTKIAPMPLYYRITATGTGDRSTTSTIQVSYVPTQGSLPLNVSFTPASGLVLGQKVALGVSGLSVPAISITTTGLDTAFTYTISAEPPRVLGY